MTIISRNIDSFSPVVGKSHELIFNHFPTRYVIGITAFFCSIISFAVRSSFSLSLLAMVIVRDENGTVIEQPDFGPRYDWSAYDQGLLLGAFYYSYPLATLPVGLLIDRFEIGRLFIAAGFVLSALLTAVSPMLAASGTIWWLFASQLLLGIAQSGNFVNVHRLLSRWTPHSELGRFAFIVMGSNVGIVLAWMITGTIIERFGWQWSFYMTTALVAAFVGVWLYTMYDSPARHPRISLEERQFIEANVPPPKRQQWPPFGRMMGSAPFWALVSLVFAYEWGLYFMITSVPKFLNQVLGFQMSSTGCLAALPYVARTVSAFGFGYIGDRIRTRNLVSVTVFRKLFCVVSHVLPSLMLFAIIFVNDDQPYVFIILIVVAMIFNGAVTQTNVSNYHDIAPTMAASTMATVNLMSASTGFITPMVVAYFTSERNTIVEWRYVFMCAAGVYLIAALVFMVFGSAEDQRWSEPRNSRHRKTSSV